jgi:protein-L-isoaspartate(D-aspartate) O-methyltransferase
MATCRQDPKRPGSYESGVIAHGPQAESLAEQYADLLRRWARSYCRRGTAKFSYWPGTPLTDLPRNTFAVAKQHGILTIT